MKEKQAPSLIVGFSGYATTGKDTAADALNGMFARVALADQLKEEVAKGLGVPAKEFVARMSSDPQYKKAVRPLLVEWGRFRRSQDAMYWVNALAVRIVAKLEVSGPRNFTITDVRYANEAGWIRKSGGFIIGVERPGVGPDNEEERESFLAFRPDFTILNDKSVDELRESVRKIVAVQLEKRRNGN